jgi:predicted LPLAT superfamily acyltransferase
MPQTPTQTKIEAKKRGNRLGFLCFEILLKLGGLKCAYALLYFVCLHYLIFDQKAVAGALSYLRRRFPRAKFLKLRLEAYRLFISQGKQLIDRAAILAGKDLFDIQLQGYAQLKAILEDKNKGFVLLTSHTGNWQAALTVLKKMDKPVYLVMRPEDNQAVKKSLNIDAQDSFIRILSPEGYLGGVVEAMQVLKEGNIVSIMGDRKYGFEATEISFLKDRAYFPIGAFSLAASSNCPIVVLLSAKLAQNKYLVDVSHILYPRYNSNKDKRKQLQVFAQQFADILDEYAEKYPYQCFLFHDVWKKTEPLL